jgi:hypothetical protein
MGRARRTSNIDPSFQKKNELIYASIVVLQFLLGNEMYWFTIQSRSKDRNASRSRPLS